MNNVVVGQEELGRFIRDALMAAGARTEDATIVADGLVWANLRGVDGHGVSRLPSYLKMIDRGDIDVKANRGCHRTARQPSFSMAVTASARSR